VSDKGERSVCGVCKWFECYDDGCGCYDMWCAHPKVNISNCGETDFLYKDVDHCPFFEES